MLLLELRGELFTNSYPLHFADEDSGSVGGTGAMSVRLHRRMAADGLRNVSNRSWCAPGKPAITGFIVEGDAPRWMLIRGIGPTLVEFGVENAAANPRVSLFSDESERVLNDLQAEPSQKTGLEAAFALVGAFPLVEGSADKALLVLLAPGNYTVHASAGEAEAEVLTEVYQLPFDSADRWVLS